MTPSPSQTAPSRPREILVPQAVRTASHGADRAPAAVPQTVLQPPGVRAAGTVPRAVLQSQTARTQPPFTDDASRNLPSPTAAAEEGALEVRARPQHSILSAIGRTPLLELPRLARHLGLPKGTRLLAKAEHLNPGGSAKDRLALALVAEAERKGLRPGGVLVEATSGNTGIALAQVAAVRGYRLHVVSSEKVSEEKIRVLEAFGAVVHRVPNVPHGHPDHYASVAPRLARELGGFYLDQFHAPANSRAHEEATGPELVAQARALGTTLTAFVCGVGTGGTLTGIARHLRAASPWTRVVLADPEGSILADGGEPRPYKVEGIGDDVVPALYDPGLVDEAVTVSDADAFRHALLAARLEGLLVGGSSGAHLAAAAAVARTLPPGSTVATILADSGRNYLSKFLDPEWCRANGLDDVWDGIEGVSP